MYLYEPWWDQDHSWSQQYEEHFVRLRPKFQNWIQVRLLFLLLSLFHDRPKVWTSLFDLILKIKVRSSSSLMGHPLYFKILYDGNFLKIYIYFFNFIKCRCVEIIAFLKKYWIIKNNFKLVKNYILPGIVFLIYFLFLYFSLNLSEREWEYRFVSVERKFSRTQTSLNQTFSRPSKSKKSNKIQKKYKNTMRSIWSYTLYRILIQTKLDSFKI